MKKHHALVAGLFLISALPLNAGERLMIGVSPEVAMAPATVRVRTTVEANPENRAILIIADSPEFYRSSEIPLDGERAPRTTTVEFRSLPSGMYTVTAVLIRVNGHTIASRALNIVGPGTE